MISINLPSRFKKKLEQDSFLDGIVKKVIYTFGEILNDNKLYFFEEYTEHGKLHIESVLNSANNLITDTAYDSLLTSKDVAYFILSVILHDIGMHLNIDSFKILLSDRYEATKDNSLDKLCWSEAWNEFLNDAKKFNEQQLKDIFGKEDTIIRNPPLHDPGEITVNDRKLIGEFLRRNHPRLAHEIAILGYPGVTQLEFAEQLDYKEKFLIGFIARSHGMDLRQCVDQVEKIFDKNSRRYPLNVHAIYLMILLRIADYIQIDRLRTSNTLLKLKTFSSPISEIEHSTHLAIDSIDDKFQDDPERIYVIASPKDSLMYLKIQKLISDIQFEFDISWAVLGELYGTIQIKPEIKYRRIKSNLDDDRFLQKQNYVADQFSFKANDDIIKLLIAPLYGNDPTYGIRELLQNSIDACHERETFEKSNALQQIDSSINVSVIKEAGIDYFLIRDNGVGMEIDVIKNYFLSAGASYRKSIDWQKMFVDADGNSVVRRSGRFGIGALAAFLIGDEIEIQTKNIRSQNGYHFVCNLNTKHINILKDDSLDIGTLIKIRLNKSTLEKLNPNKYLDEEKGQIKWFKWYTLNKPKIQYVYYGDRMIPDKADPNSEIELPKEWHEINSKGYNKITWTYSNKFNPAKFTCNGINIPYRDDPFEIKLGLMPTTPKISVFDNNGFLPLNLNRNSFTNKISFKSDLEFDVYKDYLAYILTRVDIASISTNSVTVTNQLLSYPGFSKYYSAHSCGYGKSIYKHNSYYSLLSRTLLINKEGFILDYNYFLKKLRKIDAIFIHAEHIEEIDLDINLNEHFIKFMNMSLTSIDDYKAIIEPLDYSGNDGTQIFLKKHRYDYLFDLNKKRVSLWLNNFCKKNYDSNDWIGLSLGSTRKSLLSEVFLNKYQSSINFIREYSISCNEDGNKIFDAILTKYINENIIIPFSIFDRKEMYPLAFQELAPYMKKYLNTKTWKELEM